MTSGRDSSKAYVFKIYSSFWRWHDKETALAAQDILLKIMEPPHLHKNVINTQFQKPSQAFNWCHFWDPDHKLCKLFIHEYSIGDSSAATCKEERSCQEVTSKTTQERQLRSSLQDTTVINDHLQGPWTTTHLWDLQKYLYSNMKVNQHSVNSSKNQNKTELSAVINSWVPLGIVPDHHHLPSWTAVTSWDDSASPSIMHSSDMLTWLCWLQLPIGILQCCCTKESART